MLEITAYALLFDIFLIIVASEAFRRRLVFLRYPQATQPEYPLMRPREPPNDYPFSSPRGWAATLMAVVVIWSGEHRDHDDRWLTRFAWSARLAMLALPLLFVVASRIPIEG